MTSRRNFLTGSVATAFGIAALEEVAEGAPGTGIFSRHDAQVRPLLARMSLDEKIGQMTQPDQMFLQTIDDIDTYHLGSLLNGGDSDPKSGNDLTSWTDLYDGYQARALKTKLAIPLIYGVDAVHGHNNVLGATIFPHNIGLGCSRNEKLVQDASRITAEEVRATGINWAFAPCVAVPQDIRWGRTYEGFSEDPGLVKRLGQAAVRGLQGNSLDSPVAVAGCAKHYIADGGTTFGTGKLKSDKGTARFPLDQGDTQVDEATLRRVFLPGYISAVAAGVATVMPSYSAWNGVKCSGSHKLLTDLLKRELGFEGFLISDYAALNGLPGGNYKDQIALSINAGMDMVMVPEHYREFISLLRELVNEGIVPQSRIDDAVTRILRVKFAMGLIGGTHSPMADRSLHKTFGGPDHRAVARQCVRESLVILKNDGDVLPLSKTAARIHVAGKNADNIGNQCGGWTIYWQGKTGDVIQGTTVLAALRKAAPQAQITYSLDGSNAQGATVCVVVVGELPYAEFMGDRSKLQLAREDVAAIDAVKSSGIPVVVVVISGRPLPMDESIAKANAVVAAWLPGTEGDGVADVLFGDFNPTGKLSFTWPGAASTSLHLGDPGYKAMFPFGHGLTY